MDDGDCLVIIQLTFDAGLGHFAFPAGALARHGVVSAEGQGGKRAMRV